MSYEEIELLFKNKGYSFFKGELNVNLFAIRKNVSTNVFDDEIYMVYEENENKIVKTWTCTTEGCVRSTLPILTNIPKAAQKHSRNT